ncbi:MAG: hypothetical protein IJV01_04420 [Bacteroidales bacterium]|nr:hypothetical protein [Bacteroidales bacterium]
MFFANPVGNPDNFKTKQGSVVDTAPVCDYVVGGLLLIAYFISSWCGVRLFSSCFAFVRNVRQKKRKRLHTFFFTLSPEPGEEDAVVIKYISFSDNEPNPELEGKVFHKYMAYSDAEKLLNQKALWFSSPVFWPDKYEQQFLNATYQIDGREIKHPLRGRVFVFCMTGARSSEAYWNRCNSPFSVELNIEGTRLKQLLKDKNGSFNSIYIGNVQYYKEIEVSGPNLQALRNDRNLLPHCKGWELPSEEEWVKTLFVKRDNFEYEKETRIVIVVPEKTQKKGILLRYEELFENADLIKSVVVSPNVLHSECYEAIQKNMRQHGVGKVMQSWLYSNIDKKYLHVSL